ncbi:hypothetical protein M8818_004424 [Zalaria obscura]|uniref:Uncharacterized protein n=1 Tax=Zalaria obscura TaxID=2024903 RepID=A0ACC3SB28_9PEZI
MSARKMKATPTWRTLSLRDAEKGYASAVWGCVRAGCFALHVATWVLVGANDDSFGDVSADAPGVSWGWATSSRRRWALPSRALFH